MRKATATFSILLVIILSSELLAQQEPTPPQTSEKPVVSNSSALVAFTEVNIPDGSKLAFVDGNQVFLLTLGIIQTAPEPSPDEIGSEIQGKEGAASDAVWSLLGIESDLFKSSYEFTYQVERFDLEIDGETGSDVILRISDSEGWDWQYLFFTGGVGEWKFAGNIDLPFQEGRIPGHRVVNMGERETWLVIRSMKGSGTGTSLYGETWYKVDEKGAREVLQYPVKGYVIGWGLAFDRIFMGEVVEEKLEDGIATLVVRFTVSYAIGRSSGFYDGKNHGLADFEELFSIYRKACYTWNSTADSFVIDPARSGLSQEEIDGIFNDADEEFLRHRSEELARLAAAGNDLQRKWLRQFLGKCEDSPQKKSLLERLH